MTGELRWKQGQQLLPRPVSVFWNVCECEQFLNTRHKIFHAASEDHFDDKFWESLSLFWNALDNVQARQYTDARCLFYSKPLLESGTLGTKCNHEVILPFRTSSYNDGKESDDNEAQIAMCTLRSFPYLPKHCIEYAKQAYFSD